MAVSDEGTLELSSLVRHGQPSDTAAETSLEKRNRAIQVVQEVLGAAEAVKNTPVSTSTDAAR